MDISMPFHCHNLSERKNPETNKSAGLTLIEVLIALAIISIALSAIIKAAAENVRFIQNLQDKTIALWIGQQVLNEARVGAITLPKTPEKKEEIITVLNQDWRWQASSETTPNNKIDKLKVSVFKGEEKTENTAPLLDLATYLYKNNEN